MGYSFITIGEPLINDLDVILHGFMLQIIYTTDFQAKQLSGFNSENQCFYELFSLKMNLWEIIICYLELILYQSLKLC